jgi:osmoprotectant transport system substrate-binding protein
MHANFPRSIRFIALAAVVSLGMGGCASTNNGADVETGTESSTDETITIGSKGFAESWITGELYAQVLRANGFTVSLKTNIGSSEIIDRALTSGQIDIYPEYTGVIVTSLAGITETLGTAEETFAAASEFERGRDVVLLPATPFENKNAIAVTSAFAAEHDLTSIDDLRDIGDFVYSTYPDNVSGGQGYDAIVKNYGLPNMKLRTLSIGLNYAAIAEGQIDAADVFTTDPQLLRSDLVVLDDTQNLFGFQNVVPAVRASVLDKHGQKLADALDSVNELLTIEAIQAMNGAVAVNRLDPAQVATRFLAANNLI